MSRCSKQEDSLEEIASELSKKRRQEQGRGFGKAIVILMIFSFFPYIWAFQYAGFLMHKNQARVGNVEMVARGWSESLEEYAIDFTVEVETKRYDVSSIDLHVLVYKGEQFIGHIRVDLTGNESINKDGTEYRVFKKGSTQTVYFTLTGWRNLSESDPLFQELYNGDPADYTFVPKLICVYFADGTNVGYAALSNLDYQYDENGEIQFDGNSPYAPSCQWK
ncbi:MAG: hypothetical protein IJW29_00165 [Clostridia bacterium]|nr:hypothetical protein [Clostridia bacterium]